jgi:hypothetical protein
MARANRHFISGYAWYITGTFPFNVPLDWFTYVYTTGWQAGINLCIQTPLFNLPAFEISNMALPVGNYTFYFALDAPDGTATGPWWGGLNSVEVTVQ